MAALHSTTASQQAREDRAIYRAMRLLEGRLRKPGAPMNSPGEVRQFLALRLAQEEREVFVALWLDAQHCLIAADDLFVGTLGQTSVYPREVVNRSLQLNAAAVIFAHNHPSGVAEPSQSDRLLTDALKQSLAMIDVRVLDHFIVAGNRVLSFAEHEMFEALLTSFEELPQDVAGFLNTVWVRNKYGEAYFGMHEKACGEYRDSSSASL